MLNLNILFGINLRYNKEKKVKKEVTAAMNHTARKVSMYTLMALLLVATAVMVFLSINCYGINSAIVNFCYVV